MPDAHGKAASYAQEALEVLSAAAGNGERNARAADHVALAVDLLSTDDGDAQVQQGRAELDAAITELRAINTATASPAMLDARTRALRLIERADRAAGR